MINKKPIIRIVILSLILIAVGWAVYQSAIDDKQKIEEGSVAPNFMLPLLGGDSMQLEDLRGQGIVLNFWGTWCDPCRKEMPALNQAHNKYKDRGVQVLAVNIGESDVTVNRFVEQYQLSFPILMDKQSEITALYEIGPIPTTFFIDGEGVVRRIVIGGPMSEQVIEQYIQEILPE